MRLWSIHPSYLDTKGLLAAWREGLLAQKVLAGGTRGYVHHPQLLRFRECANPLGAIGAFLKAIQEEAVKRGYAFDACKIVDKGACGPPGLESNGAFEERIDVASGQVEYEFELLMQKLETRDAAWRAKLSGVEKIDVNPVFRIRQGGIAAWEKTIDSVLERLPRR
ncbi:MAG TPA: pyrimidine dimer DNA glycosylase/endonuclease V [Rectinemataceae bacterium]